MVEGWTPNADCIIIRCWGEHLTQKKIIIAEEKQRYESTQRGCIEYLVVDRVPWDTVDCPTVTTEHSNGLIPPHMEDVHLQSHL